MKRTYVRNMTEGSIPALLLSFAAPMMVGNLFQQLYNMVDSVVVGNFVSPYALGAIGACSSLNFMIFGLCNGMGLGVGVIISQFYGAGREADVKRTIVNGAAIVTVMALVLSAVGTSLATKVLNLLQTPQEYINDSIVYYRTTCAGLIGVAAYNTIAAMMRALGDSKTPLLFLLLSSVTNIVLDLVFVLVFHLGVFGVALATIISQILSALCCILFAVRNNSFFQLKREDFRLDPTLMQRCVRIGLPIGLQNCMLSLSSVALQRVVNGFGPDAATAYTMTVRLEHLIQQPYASLSAAISSFTGQNIGAHKIPRVQQGLKVGLVVTAVFSALMGVVMHAFGGPILSIFGNEPTILVIATKALRITSFFYFPLGVIYLIRGLCNGAGDATAAMLNGVVEVTCRISLSLLLTSLPFLGMWGIWATTASTWCISAVTMVVRYRQKKWMKKGMPAA